MVIYVSKELSPNVSTQVRRYASSNDLEGQYGLGQIIKKILIRDTFDF